jgi:hypothetical protein
MDWFRWWHGTLTDPKFRWVARKSGCSFTSVITVWVAILERASNVTDGDASVTRGDVTGFDCDAHDALLDVDDGTCSRILDAFVLKGLIVDGRIASWDKRQPKREDSSAERTRAYRERKASEKSVTRGDASVTQCDAEERAVTPREEKRREEEKNIGERADVGGETRASVRPSDLSAAMRRNSIEAQPGDPRIVAAAEAGITVETIEAACAEAKAADPVGRIKAGFVVAIAQRWTADASRPPPVGRSRPQQHRSYHDERAETIAALTGRSRRNESDDRIVDVAATRLS